MSHLLLYIANIGAMWLLARLGIFRTNATQHLNWRLGLWVIVAYFDATILLWIDCGVTALFGWGIAMAFASTEMPASLFESIHERLGQARLALYLMSTLMVASLVYIHLPITTFLTSPGELDIHFEYLTTLNMKRVTECVYHGALLYLLCPSPRMKVGLTLAATFGAGMAITFSFVLPFGYPMMSGVMFEQIPVPRHELAGRGLIDAVLASVVLYLIGFALSRYRGRGLVISLTLLQVSLVIISAMNIQKDVQAGDTGQYEAATMHPLRLSKTHPNVVILLLDRFMGGYVEGVLQEEPALISRFDGFTWYPKTVSAGQNSISGLHPVFGGYDYIPMEMNKRRMSLREVSAEAYNILPYNFSNKGYEVNFVNPRGLGFSMEGDCEYLERPGVNCRHIASAVTQIMAKRYGFSSTILARSHYADLLVLLGSMRVAPYLMKETVHSRGEWAALMDHSAGTTFTEWAELKSLPELTATDAPSPTLNIMWSILPHEPYYLDEQCTPQKKRLSLRPEEVVARGYDNLFELQHRVAARCTLLLVADYIDRLKDFGVYNNTKIIIVSDHGIVGPVRDRSTRAREGNTQGGAFVRTRSVLLVKQEDAHGDLRESEVFKPNAEVPQIACEQIGGCINPYLEDRPIATKGRDDPFIVDFVPWQFSAQRLESFVVRVRVMLRHKDPYSSENWKKMTVPDAEQK